MPADKVAAATRSEPSSRRDLAVARSLDPARARAEQRVQRFLDAAFELIEDDARGDFTLQEVVDRSGQSLRSFYLYFAGKHELLLAMFEEYVRLTAEQLRQAVDGTGAPLDRLHRTTVEFYRICRPERGERSKKQKVPSAVMAEFAQQLLTDHPKEACRAFVPLVAVLDELFDAAEADGSVRADRSRRQTIGVILQAVMFNTFAATISGSVLRRDDDDAEELWQLLLGGLSPR